MLYTIGDIATKLNVAPSTLRYYDKEGLLPFIDRSSGGIRMFKESDLGWLMIINCLKQSGMPIKDIRYFIDLCREGDSSISQRLELIDAQRKSVLDQIAGLRRSLHILDYKHWYYETAKAAGTCAVHESMSSGDIPEAFHDILENTDSTGIDHI